MNEPVHLDYRLGEHGWADLTLTVGPNSIDIVGFGYCTDALGDLVRAALIVATSGRRAEVVFDGEPAQWLLVVERDRSRTIGQPGAAINLRVEASPDLTPGTRGNIQLNDDKENVTRFLNIDPANPSVVLSVNAIPPESLLPPLTLAPVFEASTTVDVFATAVRDAAQKVWDAHGAEGYNRLWSSDDHGFPLRALCALRAALDLEEAPLLEREWSAEVRSINQDYADGLIDKDVAAARTIEALRKHMFIFGTSPFKDVGAN